MTHDEMTGFIGSIRDRAEWARREASLMRNAQTALRQAIHDASSAGIPSETIAALTGLGAEEVGAITASWPSPPPDVSSVLLMP